MMAPHKLLQLALRQGWEGMMYPAVSGSARTIDLKLRDGEAVRSDMVRRHWALLFGGNCR
jgi:hypothetical protein